MSAMKNSSVLDSGFTYILFSRSCYMCSSAVQPQLVHEGSVLLMVSLTRRKTKK